VLKELRSDISDPRGKFMPNWSDLYIVKKILSGETTYLMDPDGVEF